MNISVKRKNFKDGLDIVKKAKPSSDNMPILKMVLINAKKEEGMITLTCCDGHKITNTTDVPAVVDESFDICLEMDLLISYLGKCKADDVSLSFEGTTATIKCGTSRIKLSTGDAKSYPVRSNIQYKNVATLDSAFIAGINSISFAVGAANGNNVMMAAINMVKKGDTLSLIALDGHRIASSTCTANGDGDWEVNLENEMLKSILSFDTTNLCIKIGETFVEFADGISTSRFQMVAGKYFNVASMLNSAADKTIEINKDDFLGALDRASILIVGNDKKPVVFNIKKDTLDIGVKTSVGETNETLACKTTGEELVIGFNPKLLMDALKAIKDENITIRFSSNKSPLIIKGETYAYLVLPVNIH